MARKRFTVIGGRMSYLEVDYSILDNVEELRSFTDKELLEAVENVKFANKQIETENEVFRRYLIKADPDLLRGVDSDLALKRFMKRISFTVDKKDDTQVEQQQEMERQKEMEKQQEDLDSRGELSENYLIKSPSKIRSAMGFKLLQTQSLRNMGSRASLMGGDRGPKININIKSDMVDKEMDSLLEEIEELKKRTTLIVDSLRYRTEEAMLMLKDIEESRKILEIDVCVKSVNAVSGKIPPERWIRYMQEWFKHADYITNKLRLKNVTSREFLNRSYKILAEKEELGKTLTPIDFEQLKIKNRILQKTYDTKTTHVYNLKRSTGKTNLQLTYHKNRMLSQVKEINNLKSTIERRKNKIKILHKKEKRADHEVIQKRREYYDLKLKTMRFVVRSVEEYAQAKNHLFELKRDLKKWNRQTHIQEIALQTCMETLKRLTRENKRKI